MNNKQPKGAELLQILRASTLTNRSFDHLGDGFCYIIELHNANGRRLRSYTFNGQDYFHTGLFGYRLNEPEKGALETIFTAGHPCPIQNTSP